MRISRAFVVVLAFFGLVLAACSSDEPSSELVPQSPESEGGEGASASSLPAREVTFAPVDPGMLGMHVAGAQEGDWPADSVPVSSLRLWDTGTSWLQIEATRGPYDWRGLDTALSMDA